MGERPRFLAPGTGYTENPSGAIDKLECVTGVEQRQFTALAHRRAQQRELQPWAQARWQVLGAVDAVRRECGTLARPAQESLRRIVREVDRLDRELGDR